MQLNHQMKRIILRYWNMYRSKIEEIKVGHYLKPNATIFSNQWNIQMHGLKHWKFTTCPSTFLVLRSRGFLEVKQGRRLRARQSSKTREEKKGSYCLDLGAQDKNHHMMPPQHHLHNIGDYTVVARHPERHTSLFPNLPRSLACHIDKSSCPESQAPPRPRSRPTVTRSPPTPTCLHSSSIHGTEDDKGAREKRERENKSEINKRVVEGSAKSLIFLIGRSSTSVFVLLNINRFHCLVYS